MDAAMATLNVSADLVTKGIGSRNITSRFWGENTRGSLNVKLSSVQTRKSLKVRSSKPGFANAVYAPDVNKESLVITTCMQKKKKN